MTKLPPVLVFHGALGAASQFSPLIDFLNSKGVEVRVIEFEGHGSRDLNGDFSMETFAANVDEAARECSEKPLIFGYSMGGYAAMLAAVKGTPMAGIITLGTKMSWNPEIAQKERSMLNPEKLMEKVPAFARELELRHDKIGWTHLLSKTADMMEVLGNSPSLTAENLNRIQVPVLMALGDRDEMVSAEETLQSYRQIPGSASCILPGTRHPIEKLEPGLLYFLIERWTKLAAKYPTTQKVS